MNALRPDLRLELLRGNVDTRLRKVEEGVVDAAVLACAGLDRLGHGGRIAERFAPERMLPAIGQGALGLEIRQGDGRVLGLCQAIADPAASVAVYGTPCAAMILTRSFFPPRFGAPAGVVVVQAPAGVSPEACTPVFM